MTYINRHASQIIVNLALLCSNFLHITSLKMLNYNKKKNAQILKEKTKFFTLKKPNHKTFLYDIVLRFFNIMFFGISMSVCSIFYM